MRRDTDGEDVEKTLVLLLQEKRRVYCQVSAINSTIKRAVYAHLERPGVI